VVAPEIYRFTDFAKVGLPLRVLTWATTLLVAPLFLPS
jgi:di/tricarboxylate transporter